MAKQKNWKKLKNRSVTDSLKNRDVYDTQQLDRTKVGYKQSFMSRHIITIAVSILIVFLIWLVWSFFDIKKLDNKALEDANLAIEITTNAPDEPRDLPDVKWANMILVQDDTYSNFGYTYKDKRTDAKYTEAEYNIWLEIHSKINAGEKPEILRRIRPDGTYEYKERDPIAPAPAEPRNWSNAQYINMLQVGIVEDARYADLGYSYYDAFYNVFLTKAEYDKAQSYTYERIQSLVDNNQILFRTQEYTDDDGITKTQYVFKDVLANEVVPIIPTEDAGSRYSTPIELDALTWANMMLIREPSATAFGYTCADLRTGLFYTEVEYEHWNNVYTSAKNGKQGYTFWMEKSKIDKGYVFSDAPPEKASSEPRESFNKLFTPDLILMNLTKHDFWANYGYTYYDNYTGMFYSDSEYQIWLDVQNKIATGEIIIPSSTQEQIRSKNIRVTEIVRSNLDPLPVSHTLSDGFKHIYLLKVLVCLIVGFLVYALLKSLLKKNLDAQNLMNDTSDINQYENDQHIALPEEIQLKFDWFPDAGAHSPVQVSSMISHMMLSNKGLNKIKVAKRAETDIIDEDGDIVYYKGEILLDDNGEPITEMLPMIDTAFASDLYDASEAPKEVRKTYNPMKIAYNPDGKDRTKMAGKHKTVADMINNEWQFPLYEPQRPAGAYMVDTEPVNTMVLAITRAGKGQTVIEPTIDMWTRELKPNNMVINDPKGELLVKNYVQGTVRGFQIVQFNLINAMKTDIYNPLGMAADAAREGDFTKCAMYVDNVASVFFPVDGGDDPVWPNAANNAFKRAAYGLMDYYLEEEKEIRRHAGRMNVDPKVLESKIDKMWGKVTLYNCYQLFVQLTSKKLKNPSIEFQANAKAAKEYLDSAGDNPEPHPVPAVQKLIDATDEEYLQMLNDCSVRSALWEEKPEVDLLTLYFSATDLLPRNSMRNLVANANNALKSMAGAEKMLASVYGIAITAMSFFTDPTIATLTSGAPSQNVDLAGLSFPRRLGVRFHNDFLKTNHLIGLQVRWSAFEDDMFEKKLGKDFEHEDMITREGWAKYYFKGLFPNPVTYLKMQIKNPSTGMLVREFHFKFEKSFQTSLDGRFFVTDPVLGTKIIKDGILTELKAVKNRKTGKKVYIPKKTTFKKDTVDFLRSNCEKKKTNVNAIIRTMSRYSEKPKMVFLVTPPHLMNYAKLILILIKQLVDLNFDQSYMTKANQKPLYKTRFMLDELGNLQSEGHGISGFETMLSIGLGQEQQFTLILQTLQQLRDVYGESVDKIVQGNAQPLTSKVLTPNGWKLMGDISVGDEVLTPYGTVTKVTGVYPKGIRPVYGLQLRDGSYAESCNEHLWQIERYKTNVDYKGLDEDGKKIYESYDGQKTCKLVQEVISTDELKLRVDKGRQINLPKIVPVVYPEKDLSIHPYVLGYLMGDANFDEKGHVTLTLDNKDLEVKVYMESLGYEFNQSNGSTSEKTPVYYVKNVCDKVRDLRLNGKVSFEKSIPEVYMQGSVEQRIALLQGLMDSDGTISQTGEMEFTSASEQLAKDVQTLVRSLGGRVDIHVKENVFYTSPTQSTKKQARPAYRVQNIRLFDINPFKLGRKASRWIQRSDNSGNRVVSVEYLRDEQVQCIRVEDERHLYITDDFIPTHNTSNIVYLKSTDDAMIETLQKMSGTTHKSFTDSKTITRDMQKIMMQNEGKASYTMSTREVPVVAYNDMAFIAKSNSIVFRSGDSPVWNRNETVLPMSWRLFKNTIKQPGKDYTLQTVPTLSSALDFDIKQNQPDFIKMLDKRMAQAGQAAVSMDLYKKAYNYTDADIPKLDIDAYSDDIMDLIISTLNNNIGKRDDTESDYGDDDFIIDGFDNEFDDFDEFEDFNDDVSYNNIDTSLLEDNKEVQIEASKRKEMNDILKRKIYAGGFISKDDLIRPDGKVRVHSFDKDFSEVFANNMGSMLNDSDYFTEVDGNLHGLDGKPYIIRNIDKTTIDTMNEAAQEGDTNVYAEDKINEDDLNSFGTFVVTDYFYQFLANLDAWDFADNRFEEEMARRMIG